MAALPEPVSTPESEPSASTPDYGAVLKPMVGESAEAYRARSGRAPELKAAPESAEAPSAPDYSGRDSAASPELQSAKAKKVAALEVSSEPKDERSPSQRYAEAASRFAVRERNAGRFETDQDREAQERARQTGAAVGEARLAQLKVEQQPIDSELVDKERLVKMAQDRVEAAVQGQQQAEARVEASKAGARDRFEQARQTATESYDRFDQALRASEGQERAIVSLSLSGDNVSKLQLAKVAEQRVGRAAEPFESTSYKAGERQIQRLAYRTESGGAVVERWDGQTGDLLALDVIKSPSAIQTLADPESKAVGPLMRGLFRQLAGREAKVEHLSREARRALPALSGGPEKQPSARASETVSISGGLVENLRFLGVSEPYIQRQAKPHRPSFFELLFGRRR